MKFRHWINHHSLPITCVALAMLVSSLYYLQATMSPPAYVIPTTAYYYDTVTNELFPGKINELPPIATPAASHVNEQPAGVLAHVFSCSSCSDKKSLYIGYLETYTQEAREAQLKIRQILTPPSSDDLNSTPESYESPEPALLQAVESGHLVAAGASPANWVSESSESGSAIIAAALHKCPTGQYPTQCLPEKQ